MTASPGAPGASGPPGPDRAWSAGPDDRCYRHPDRISFALCQRCARTICPECQTQAPVGVVCPECLRGADGSKPARTLGGAPRLRSATGRGGAALPFGLRLTATNVILLVTVAVSLAQLAISTITGRDPVAGALEYAALYSHLGGGRFEPWRELTYALVHGSILHLFFNAFTLWIFGRAVEDVLGPLRFALLYVAGALGGAAAVALLAPHTAVIGASGAIFGLMGAYLVVMRTRRMDARSLLVLLGINLALGFTGGISWQAHVGGLLVGLIAGRLLLRDVDAIRPAGAGPARAGLIATSGIAVALALAPLLVTVFYRAGTGF